MADTDKMQTIYNLEEKLESLGWDIELNSGGFQYAEKIVKGLNVIIGFNEMIVWVDTHTGKGRVPTPITDEVMQALSLIQEWKNDN